MKTTQRVAPRPAPSDQVVATEIRYHGRVVVPGTELSIEGVPGRFRFIRHVQVTVDEWIDVFGGRPGREMTRSFRPNRIKTVHRKRVSRGGAS